MSKEFMGDLFLAEDQADEAAMLMGKVNALHGLWKATPESIDERLIGAMFGFKETRDGELQDAVEKQDRYYEYWQSEKEKRKLAEERADALQKLLDQRMEQDSGTGCTSVLKGMEG